MEDADQIAFEICERIRRGYSEISSTISPFGNIYAAFFHDLVVHFTGIIIHRNAVGDYGPVTSFPWVSRKYSLTPSELNSEAFAVLNKSTGLSATVRSAGLLPVAIGRSIPIDEASNSYRQKLLKILLSAPQEQKFFLPKYATQTDSLRSLVSDICNEFQIDNETKIWGNWVRYLAIHTTGAQRKIPQKGVLVGTRNNLENRKLALNFLQQEKQVVGFTHGEISNHVFNEPVYSYSDRTLCTTLIEYGDFSPKKSSFPPIIRPLKEVRRDSQVIRRFFNPTEKIGNCDLRDANVLLIPTIYQENHLYGPKHSYETKKYYAWHKALEEHIPNLTVKVHPKTRFRPTFIRPIEVRPLEQCIEDYDLLIFDFIATGVAFALFSGKPVIYFDIGLRNIDAEFRAELNQRGSVFEIDFSRDWGEQITAALIEYRENQKESSNLGLAKYSLVQTDKLSIARTIFDIIGD